MTREQVQSRFSCFARRDYSDPPQDCDWPLCSCDATATKVVGALIEMGWQPPTRPIPPGSTAEYERAQELVANWIGPDGDAYIDHIGSHRARALIRSIANAIVSAESATAKGKEP